MRHGDRSEVNHAGVSGRYVRRAVARGEHGHQVRGTEWASLAATAVAGEAARPASWSSAR